MHNAKLILEVAQLMLKVVQDMRALSDSVQAVCVAVTEGLSVEQPKAIAEKSSKAKEPEISLEKVRSVLAKKSEAGFTAEVRGIIQKYGANRLSEIEPEYFEAVIADAEGLNNG